MFGAHGFLGFIDKEFHAVEFQQQIVRKLDVGFINFVDQQHRAHRVRERVPQLAFDDVVADVVHLGIAQLAIAKTRHGIVLVKST